MKLSIPATTFATLLAGKSVPSKSDTILYTELATKADSDIEIELLRRSYEQNSLRIKQKAKARIESKKRLLLAFHDVSREAFLATTGKLCDPTTATDLGVLDDSCHPDQFCIEDSASELGGVCAKVVVRKADNHQVEAHVEGGGVDVEDVGGEELLAKGSRSGDIVGVMKQKTQVRDGSESKVQGGDEYMTAVDRGDFSNGGYKDSSYGDVDGSVNSKYHEYESVEPIDEGRQGVEDSVKTVSSSKLLKPASMQNIWKADHILERSRAGSEEYLSLVSGECNPGTNDGYVDVGIFNGCGGNGFFCSKDSSSNLGGTCVNIGSTADESLPSRDLFEGGNHRHLLTSCDYLNGTSGEKCSGLRACMGLSSDFIANNIGCGSCNGYGACRGLSATSSVGEGSCNGGNGCRNLNTKIGNSFSTASTLTVNDQSCNQYYACSYGQVTIHVMECTRAWVLGEIPPLARRAATKMELVKTCLATQLLDSTVAMIATPAYPPQGILQLQIRVVMVHIRALRRQMEVRVTKRLHALKGQNCCNGEEACKQITSANMTVNQNSCNMKGACKFPSGDDIVIEGGCTG
eukprot:scaffold108757_cov60-Cyclotella_meneghiniana.AAC.6